MRTRSSRSFTVEIKSGGRHQRTIIPHRAIALAVPRPTASWPPPAEPQAATAEPRRILPRLILTELVHIELERTQITEDRAPRPRRGRPRKTTDTFEMNVEPIVKPAIKTAPAQPVPAPAL